MQTVIFDFDGTIADSLTLGVDIVNSLSDKFGYRWINDEELQKFRGMKARDILKDMRVSIAKVLVIGPEVASIFRQKADQVRVFSGLKNVIDILHSRGIVVGVVTKTNLEVVSAILTKAGIEVDFLEQDKTLFSKEKAIKKAIKDNKVDKSKVTYVGDEVRDIEAAKKAGIPIISVTWGYNNKEILAKNNNILVYRPSEIPEMVERVIDE